MTRKLQRDSEFIGYGKVGRLVVKEDAWAVPINVGLGKDCAEFPIIPGHAIVDPHDLKPVNSDPFVVQDANPYLPEGLQDLRTIGKLIVVARYKK